MLAALEPSICDLHEVDKLELKDNPLQRPPAAIARQGIGAIRKYFQEIVMTGDRSFQAARVILLGHVGCGKTTMQREMRLGSQPIVSGHEPTMQMEMQYMVLGEGAKQKNITIWDFSGGTAYAAGQQQYIVDGSIYLLCVPCIETMLLNAQYKDYVGRFLDYLELNAPSAIVLPVVTKCDIVTPERGDRNTVAMEGAAAAQGQWVLDAIERHQSAIPENERRMRIQRSVAFVSSLSGYDSSIDGLNRRIEAIILADSPMLPTIGMPVPRVLHLSMVFLRALRDGRDPNDSARAADLGYIPSAMSTDQRKCRPYMAFDEANRQFFDDFVPALKLPVTSDQTLTDAMKLLAANGECTFSTGGTVYLSPDYVLRLTQPLVDERIGNRLWQARTLGVAEAVRSTVTGTPMMEAERNAIVLAAEHFSRTGELREELLPVFWEPLGVRRDDYGEVLGMLCLAGMLLLVERAQIGRKWMMPMRLPEVSAAEAKEQWRKASARESCETLGITIALGPIRPAGVLERVLVACQGFGRYECVWKSGAHLAAHSLKDVSDVLIELREVTSERRTDVRRGSAMAAMPVPTEMPLATDGVTKAAGVDKMCEVKRMGEFELRLDACGSPSARSGIWASLMHIHRIAREICDEVPGLAKRTTSALCCPGCVRLGTVEQTFFDLSILVKKSMACEKCSETLDLHATTLDNRVEGLAYSLNMLIEPTLLEPEYKFTSSRLRLGRPLEAFYSLAKVLGLADAEEVERLRSLGEQAINSEITLRFNDCQMTDAMRDEHQWSDLDWLHYLQGLPNDADHPCGTSHKKVKGDYAALAKQAKANGVDAGHKETTLDWFAGSPIAVSAGLHRGHILALRR